MKLLALKPCLLHLRRLFHFRESLIRRHAAKETGDAENQPKHRFQIELKPSVHGRILAGWRFKVKLRLNSAGLGALRVIDRVKTGQAFFEDYLISQRGLGAATIRSYRDVLKLFLGFVADGGRRKLTRLAVTELTFPQVQDFLKYIEATRRNSISTRNHRLTVLRVFFEYLARRAPEVLQTSQQVVAIPTKRTPPLGTYYLERDDVGELLHRLPVVGRHASRDRALLLFLYNTGARAQEVADVRASHLDLGAHPRVRLHGKGDRWRTCPLWTTTVQELRRVLDGNGPPTGDAPVFAADSGRALTRFGIYKIVRRHAAAFENARGKLLGFSLSPHIFRHTAAVHLLESGTEVNVIRGWLGHVSLDSTHRYAEINAKIKEVALRACVPPIDPSDERLRRAGWKNDEELLKWLNSL